MTFETGHEPKAMHPIHDVQCISHCNLTGNTELHCALCTDHGAHTPLLNTQHKHTQPQAETLHFGVREELRQAVTGPLFVHLNELGDAGLAVDLVRALQVAPVLC
jgi:hypothetical protein